MSQERGLRKIPEVSRTTHGGAIAERRRLAQARKTDPQAERIFRFAIPSRETVLGMLDLRTHNNQQAHELFENNILLLTEFIDARILAANGDRTLITQFIQRADPRSETYNSEFAQQVDSLNTHFHIVLDCFPRKRK